MAETDDPFFNPYTAPKAEVGSDAIRNAAGEFAGYGGFWIRWLAVIIDGLIVGVVGFIVNMGIMFIGMAAMGPRSVMGPQPGQPVNPSQMAPFFILQAIQILVNITLNVGYGAFMTSSSSQATVGKMALGLKVVDVNGQRLTLGRAIGREFAKILSGIICYIGFIMAAFDERKQGLHDKIAGTYVIKTR